MSKFDHLERQLRRTLIGLSLFVGGIVVLMLVGLVYVLVAAS